MFDHSKSARDHFCHFPDTNIYQQLYWQRHIMAHSSRLPCFQRRILYALRSCRICIAKVTDDEGKWQGACVLGCLLCQSPFCKLRLNHVLAKCWPTISRAGWQSRLGASKFGEHVRDDIGIVDRDYFRDGPYQGLAWHQTRQDVNQRSAGWLLRWQELGALQIWSRQSGHPLPWTRGT